MTVNKSYISSERMIFMAQKKKLKKNMNNSNVWIAALIGGGIALAVSIILILITPFFLVKAENPNAFAETVAYISLFIGGLTGGFISANSCRQMPFRSAAISASVTALPILLISFFIPGGFNVIGAIIIMAIIYGSTFLGAFLLTRGISNKKRSMKKALKRR